MPYFGVFAKDRGISFILPMAKSEQLRYVRIDLTKRHEVYFAYGKI